jgi:hypothetical protein
MEKKPVGYFKLENWKNQAQIDRGSGFDDHRFLQVLSHFCGFEPQPRRDFLF